MRIQISCGLADTKREIYPSGNLKKEFVPRVGDTIVWNNLYWTVKDVVIDYHYDKITIWVKDSETFG